jgi:cephalosporin hydroxylase
VTKAQDAVGLHGANQDDWELGRLVPIIEPWLQGGVVVEIGCDQGGTLWLWRQLAECVVGVTLHTRKDGQFKSHGAQVIVGDSTDPAVRNKVQLVVYERSVDMVFVDGGHDYFTAMQDIQWAFQLAPHGIIVVHDINRRIGHPEIETYMAWAELCDDRPHMTIARRGDGSPGTGIIFPRGL